MIQPNDRILYLNRARRTLCAIALGLVVSGFAATAALADVCQYSNGQRDLGPCLQFEGGTGGSYELYCMAGPTSKYHSIRMKSGDSFTCKVPADRSSAIIAETNSNGYRADHFFRCEIDQKQVLKLVSPARENYSGRWESECRELQESLRW